MYQCYLLRGRCDALFLGGDLSNIKHLQDEEPQEREGEMEFENANSYEDKLLRGRIFRASLSASLINRIVYDRIAHLLGSWKCLN